MADFEEDVESKPNKYIVYGKTLHQSSSVTNLVATGVHNVQKVKVMAMIFN